MALGVVGYMELFSAARVPKAFYDGASFTSMNQRAFLSSYPRPTLGLTISLLLQVHVVPLCAAVFFPDFFSPPPASSAFYSPSTSFLFIHPSPLQRQFPHGQVEHKARSILDPALYSERYIKKKVTKQNKDTWGGGLTPGLPSLLPKAKPGLFSSSPSSSLFFVFFFLGAHLEGTHTMGGGKGLVWDQAFLAEPAN